MGNTLLHIQLACIAARDGAQDSIQPAEGGPARDQRQDVQNFGRPCALQEWQARQGAYERPRLVSV
jgi:hypothetical protein